MHTNIRHFIDRSFSYAPKNAKSSEIKESLFADLTDKYDDLISRGKTPEEAYNEVIAGVGDLSELCQSLVKEAEEQHVETERDRRRSALLVASSVFLYILSPIFFFVGERLGGDLVGIGLFLFTAGLATAIIIYYNMTKPAWKRERDKDPDDVDNWAMPKERRVFNALSSALWVLAIVVFLILGFTTGLWYILWVIFPITVVITLILQAVLAATSKE